MKFSNLIKIVKDAISICEIKIKNDPKKVLSEADFERLLSNEIACLLETPKNTGRFVVHNQISHYPSYIPCQHDIRDYQVDILLMKDKAIKKDNIHHKEFFYCGDSIAIELKYVRNSDDYKNIKTDLDKYDSLMEKPNCAFFVVALLEKSSIRTKVEQMIEQYREENKITNDYFITYVITK